jgi:hypothetical protein
MIEKVSRDETVDQEETLDYKNAALPIKDRVADLLNRMTVEEKVAQMLCIWGQKKTMLCDEKGNPDLRNLKQYLPHGIGQIGRISDTAGGRTACEMAELANQLQKLASVSLSSFTRNVSTVLPQKKQPAILNPSA